jgi:hypothetical protein
VSEKRDAVEYTLQAYKRMKKADKAYRRREMSKDSQHVER